MGLGARFSNATDPVRFLSKPEFGKAPVFVDTDTFQAETITSYNVEAYWQSGPLWLGGEYILTDIDAPSLNDPKFSGYHVMASWIFSGEQRRYIAKKGLFSPVPVARSIMQNGNGSWEVFARWSSVDLTDGLVEGGEMDIISVGLNWWLTPTFNTSINFRQIELDRFGGIGKSTGMNIRIMVMTN